MNLPAEIKYEKKGRIVVVTIDRPDAMNATQLAEALGISKGRMSQIRTGGQWPVELALAAERVTGGALDASLLNPLVAQARTSGAAA